jgi:hypothetical protein
MISVELKKVGEKLNNLLCSSNNSLFLMGREEM